MILAARVLAATGFDLFESPEVLRTARAEHQRRLDGHGYQSLLGPDQKPPLDYRDSPGQREQ
jgi:aminobenzoyl-glutamate utilization protein B